MAYQVDILAHRTGGGIHAPPYLNTILVCFTIVRVGVAWALRSCIAGLAESEHRLLVGPAVSYRRPSLTFGCCAAPGSSSRC